MTFSLYENYLKDIFHCVTYPVVSHDPIMYK